MGDEALRQEVDTNYDYFQRNLANYLPNYRGKYALLKQAHVVGFFDRPGDAYREGVRRFPDRIFSIQEATDEPEDLGFFSHALG